MGRSASLFLLLAHAVTSSAAGGDFGGVHAPSTLQLRGNFASHAPLRLRGGGIPFLSNIFGGGPKTPGPRIIIAGAPASGKGTQCEFLVKTFGVPPGSRIFADRKPFGTSVRWKTGKVPRRRERRTATVQGAACRVVGIVVEEIENNLKWGRFRRILSRSPGHGAQHSPVYECIVRSFVFGEWRWCGRWCISRRATRFGSRFVTPQTLDTPLNPIP